MDLYGDIGMRNLSNFLRRQKGPRRSGFSGYRCCPWKMSKKALGGAKQIYLNFFNVRKNDYISIIWPRKPSFWPETHHIGMANNSQESANTCEPTCWRRPFYVESYAVLLIPVSSFLAREATKRSSQKQLPQWLGGFIDSLSKLG